MNPDITIWSATIGHPVVFTNAGVERALLSGHCDMEVGDIEWVCMERVSTGCHHRFRELHKKIIAACIAARNNQTSKRRLDELASGGY